MAIEKNPPEATQTQRSPETSAQKAVRDATQQELDKLRENLKAAYEKHEKGSATYDLPENYRFANAVLADSLSKKIFDNLETEYNGLQAMKGTISDEEFRTRLTALKERIKNIPQIFEKYIATFLGVSNTLSPEAVAKISRDSQKFAEIISDKDCERILEVFKWALNIKVQGERTTLNDADALGYLNEALAGNEPKQKEMAYYVLFITNQKKREPLLEKYLGQPEMGPKVKDELKTLSQKGVISPMEMEQLAAKFNINLTDNEKKQNENIYANATDVRKLSRALTADSIGSKNLGDLFTGRNLIGFIGNISGTVSGILNVVVNAKTIYHNPSKIGELAPHLALSGTLMFNQELEKGLYSPNKNQVKVATRMEMNRLINIHGWHDFFNTDEGIAAQAFADYLGKIKDEDKKLDPRKITAAGFKEFLEKPETKNYGDTLARLKLKESDLPPAIINGDLQQMADIFERLDIKNTKMYKEELEASKEIS